MEDVIKGCAVSLWSSHTSEVNVVGKGREVMQAMSDAGWRIVYVAVRLRKRLFLTSLFLTAVDLAEIVRSLWRDIRRRGSILASKFRSSNIFELCLYCWLLLHCSFGFYHPDYSQTCYYSNTTSVALLFCAN